MNTFRGLSPSEAWALAAATAAHLDLVAEALALAIVIGVPLGILATRSRQAERVVLGVANALQTIPSLALLGFLLFVFHGQIGKPPARAALVVYALLPIIKNTILGLRSIDRGVAEAALGMGMTAWQRLILVELPLAIPIVVGGIRLATVSAVGMATIAAAIGAKGLGSYIFRGVEISDVRQILLGSIPAALLALACDAALGEGERALDPTRPGHSRLRAAIALVAVAILTGFAAWGWWIDLPATHGEAPIVIGSKDGSEMIVLGHMLADLVEANTPLHVERKFNLGGTLVCYNALKRGGLDVYVEYTGTALTAILKQPPERDPERVRATVRKGLARDGVECFSPFGFENTFALLMRRDQAAQLGIRRISDLAAHTATIRSGFGPEFMHRPDGFTGLTQAYGLQFAQTPREMNRNLLYQAIAQGSIDLGAGDSTDGRIATFDLVQLEDDRRYFPPYEAVPLVSASVLNRHPSLRRVLDTLAGQIDVATMRELNRQVDEVHRDPAVLAREFLRERGLLPKRP